MDTTKSSASAHSPARGEGGRCCEVCGVSSHQKILVGLRYDRRRDGERFCLPHHPDSMAGSVRSVSLVGAL